jgi:ATP-binding cassette subfamily B protein/subfamily B ATP-binding cassette protein MsbA
MEAAAMRAVEIVSSVGQFLVVVIGATQVLRGQMTPGDILIFSSYVTKVFKPVDNLVKLMAKLMAASVSVQRIGELLEVEPGIKDHPNAIDVKEPRGEISFENVSFDYGDGKHVIQDVSFQILPGQCVALVGASGAGKSTIAALIPRLFDPQLGTVRIDGVDIREYRRDSLRRQIGVVLQDHFLVGAAIRDNIRCGDLNATDEEIIRATRAAEAHEFIMAMENGYDTILGERGVTLSGGQKQRLALARAFIRRSPILILDEPMTGLDVRNEAAVKLALQRLMSERTCLLITHDLHLAASVDRILVLDRGRIVEQGSHDELMTHGGPYAKLFRTKREKIHVV